jgi:hypothetical protein
MLFSTVLIEAVDLMDDAALSRCINASFNLASGRRSNIASVVNKLAVGEEHQGVKTELKPHLKQFMPFLTRPFLRR